MRMLAFIACFAFNVILAAPVFGVDCTLSVPANPTSAAGLMSVYEVAGAGCNQADVGTFVQGACFDPATGSLGVYNPLVVDQGTTPAAPPAPLTLAKGSICAVWFGTNANTITLTGAGAKNCINGLPGGSIFGQFAYCGAVEFFKHVNAGIAAGKITIPAPGTAADGKECPTTRDFSVIDQDQSDNINTAYLVTADGKVAQATAANRKLFPTATEIDNGSDNRLLTNFIAPALNCNPFQATDLADPNNKVFALPLNELQAAVATNPVAAVVPAGDPMVLDGNNQSKTKVNLYRVGVNQPKVNNLNDASTTKYCQDIVSNGLPRIIINQARFSKETTPDPAVGTNLFTFLASRSSTTISADGLNCVGLLNISNPWTLVTDGNGVVTSATLALPGIATAQEKNTIKNLRNGSVKGILQTTSAIASAVANLAAQNSPDRNRILDIANKLMDLNNLFTATSQFISAAQSNMQLSDTVLAVIESEFSAVQNAANNAGIVEANVLNGQDSIAHFKTAVDELDNQANGFDQNLGAL